MVEEELDYIFERDGEKLRLEGVPTWVCERCDFTQVSDEVVDAIEDMLEHLDTVQEELEEE